MEKVLRKFASAREAADPAYVADLADREEYRRMTMERRLEMLLLAFNSRGVEYVIVGGVAMAAHAEPRFTGDLDLLVRPTPDNALRAVAALADFGLGSLGVTPEDLTQSGMLLQLGIRPYRIDMVTQISGVDAEEVWRGRVNY
jgi:hypothetical protein